MTTYVYKCPSHGEFDLVRDRADDLAFTACPHWLSRGVDMADSFEDGRVVCGKKSPHIIKIAAAFVPGGTGAGKDMHLPR